jgi:formate dehydrogenase assembly factor FdhD
VEEFSGKSIFTLLEDIDRHVCVDPLTGHYH